jgi:hypothetical protein
MTNYGAYEILLYLKIVLSGCFLYGVIQYARSFFSIWKAIKPNDIKIIDFFLIECGNLERRYLGFKMYALIKIENIIASPRFKSHPKNVKLLEEYNKYHKLSSILFLSLICLFAFT